MASAIEAIFIGGPLALLYFLIVPAAAWVVALLVGLRAWRSLRSTPLEVPPSVHAGLVWRVYGMVTLDVLLFGFVLWLLWSPWAQALEAGGTSGTIDAEFSALTLTGQVYAEIALVVCLTQAMVFQLRTRDFIGPFFARIQALLAIPVLGGVCGLLAGYRGAMFVADVVAPPGGPSASTMIRASTGLLFLAVAALAIPVGTGLGLRQDLASRDGFARAVAVSVLGVVPAFVATLLLWVWALAP